jgi:hypothetical protein
MILLGACGDQVLTGVEEPVLDLGVVPLRSHDTPVSASVSLKGSIAKWGEMLNSEVHPVNSLRILGVGLNENTAYLNSVLRYRALPFQVANATFSQELRLRRGYDVLAEAFPQNFTSATTSPVFIEHNAMSVISIHGPSCGLNTTGHATAVVQHNWIETGVPVSAWRSHLPVGMESRRCECDGPAQLRVNEGMAAANLQIPSTCNGPGGGGGNTIWLCLSYDWYDGDGNYMFSETVGCWPVSVN